MHVRYIYWFSYFRPELPSVRYRAVYPLELLRSRYGVDYAIAFPGYDGESVLHFLRMYFSALLFRKKDSVIVVQKLYTRRIYALAMKFLFFCRRRHTQYDLDDAEYLVFPPQTIHYFLRRSSACSAGSEELLRYIRHYNPKQFLLSSPVTAHGTRKTRRNELFTVGWVGCYGGAHLECLEQLVFPALERLPFPLKLVLLGVTEDEHERSVRKRFAGNKNLVLEIPRDIDWMNEAAVYARITQFDAGLSPLQDIEMHRSKSAFKLKQYFSCGVPVAGSALGENGRFLSDNVNGFVCNSVSDYRQAILRLYAMSDVEYAAFSQAALETVPQFSLESYCETLLAFYSGKEKKDVFAVDAIPPESRKLPAASVT